MPLTDPTSGTLSNKKLKNTEAKQTDNFLLRIAIQGISGKAYEIIPEQRESR